MQETGFHVQIRVKRAHIRIKAVRRYKDALSRDRDDDRAVVKAAGIAQLYKIARRNSGLISFNCIGTN